MTHKPVTIIGIDPGYDRIGWGVGTVEGNQLRLLHFGCIETKKSASLFDRYRQLDQELTEILQKFHPTEAAVETLFFSKNQKTALQVSESRGIILSCLLRNSVSLYEYNPVEVKLSVTGYGKSDKTAVMKMVKLQMGAALPTSTKLILDDTMDAIAIAMTHAARRKLAQL